MVENEVYLLAAEITPPDGGPTIPNVPFVAKLLNATKVMQVGPLILWHIIDRKDTPVNRTEFQNWIDSDPTNNIAYVRGKQKTWNNKGAFLKKLWAYFQTVGTGDIFVVARTKIDQNGEPDIPLGTVNGWTILLNYENNPGNFKLWRIDSNATLSQFNNWRTNNLNRIAWWITENPATVQGIDKVINALTDAVHNSHAYMGRP